MVCVHKHLLTPTPVYLFTGSASFVAAPVQQVQTLRFLLLIGQSLQRLSVQHAVGQNIASSAMDTARVSAFVVYSTSFFLIPL